MTTFDFNPDQFRAEMLAAGYDEVLERPWAPGTMLDTHTHPFEANAIVVQGEMWLTVEGSHWPCTPETQSGARKSVSLFLRI